MSGTLPPTETRRSEARARGEVVVSPAAQAGAAIAAGAAWIYFGAPGAIARVVELARTCWSGENFPVGDLGWTLARVALPACLAAWAGAVAAGAIQTRGLFTARAFSHRKRPADDAALPAIAWAAALALALLGVMAARAGAYALAQSPSETGALASSGRAISALAFALRWLAPRALGVLAAAALADWAWRRLRHERALLMTRAELEAERREEEGDPRLRAERRRRHRALTAEKS